jgi:hypothetical protein
MKKMTTLTMGVLLSFTSYSQLLTESFNDVTTLPGNGWTQLNVSTTVGSTSWFEGNNTVFKSYAGTPKQYIAANFNNTTGSNTISNWLITPVISMNNGDIVEFYTRTATGSTFPDRLQVRLSDMGASSISPINDSDVGSYTNLLLEINPTLAVGGFPEDWTLQSINVSGFTGTTNARIAFRYYVTDGGPSGTNSSYIGIDEVNVASTLSINDVSLKGLNYFFNKDTKILFVESISPLNKITIYNLVGQKVFAYKLEGNSNKINLSAIKSGIYLTKFEGEANTSKTIKLIIH